MLRIRPYQLGDVDALFAAVRESIAEISPWMDWCHPKYAIDESRSWIAAVVAKFSERSEFNFVIESEGSRFLGGCGLNGFTPGGDRANLGYWVRTSATRAGVASEAARQLAIWAWANTALVRLEIIADIANSRSQRVAGKAGAEREGVLRRRIRRHGALHDAVSFSLIRPGA